MNAVLMLLAVASSQPQLADVASRCPIRLRNGQVLEGKQPPAERGHSVTVKNSAASHAFVKVRDLIADKSTLFFVDRGQTASVKNLLDGIYEVSFAFGGHLASDCVTLIAPIDVQKFPGSAKLITREEADGYVVPNVTYTLFTVRNGNVKAKKISIAEFNRD